MIVPDRAQPGSRSSRAYFGLALRVAGAGTVILGVYVLLVSESPIQGLSESLSWMIPLGVLLWIVAVALLAAGLAVRAGEEEMPALSTPVHDKAAAGWYRSRDGWIASARLGIERKFPSVFQLEWTLTLLQSLDGPKFVKLTAAYFRVIGFHTIALDDGRPGIDVWLYEEEEAAPMGVVECLPWGDALVGARAVKRFLEAVELEGLENGVMITTGTFSEESMTLAMGKKLELISGEEFLAKLGALPEVQSQELLRRLVMDQLDAR